MNLNEKWATFAPTIWSNKLTNHCDGHRQSYVLCENSCVVNDMEPFCSTAGIAARSTRAAHLSSLTAPRCRRMLNHSHQVKQRGWIPPPSIVRMHYTCIPAHPSPPILSMGGQCPPRSMYNLRTCSCSMYAYLPTHPPIVYMGGGMAAPPSLHRTILPLCGECGASPLLPSTLINGGGYMPPPAHVILYVYMYMYVHNIRRAQS